MNFKLNLVVTCFVLLAWYSSYAQSRNVPNQYNADDSEVEFVTGSPGAGRGGPRGIFKGWMDFIQGFFKEGNWDEGGPKNFAKFIGNQVSKLVEILTRDDNRWFDRK